MKKLILLAATVAVLTSSVSANTGGGSCPDGSIPWCVEILGVKLCYCRDSGSDNHNLPFDGVNLPDRINEGLIFPGGQDGRIITPHR